MKAKVSDQRARQLSTLNVVAARAESYTRPDGVNVIALGHVFAGQQPDSGNTVPSVATEHEGNQQAGPHIRPGVCGRTHA